MNKDEGFFSLRREIEPGTPIYLLVDPVLGDPLPDMEIAESASHDEIRVIRESVWLRYVEPVLLDRSIKLPISLHPYLVLLEGPEDDWLAQSYEMAKAERDATWNEGLSGKGTGIHKFGGWLKSAMPAQKLAEQLGKWMYLQTERIVPEHYLRLADSRVLALLTNVVSESVMVSAMGRLAQWLYLDAHGSLRSLMNPLAHLADEKVTGLPCLTQGQWHAIQLGAVIHASIAQAFGQRFLDSGGNWKGNPPYGFAQESATRWQEKQEMTGFPMRTLIQGSADLVAAVSLSLLHPNWESQQTVLEYCKTAGTERGLSFLSREIHQLLSSNPRMEKV